MVSSKRIVIVCPGRGSYTAESLGYLHRPQAPGRFREFLADLDDRRKALGDPTISELDSKSKFSPSLHTRGEHASPLIYACAYRDFLAVNRDQYEIVAICGNSMGWYLTLAFGGALDWTGAFHVIQTMGGMMRARGSGSDTMSTRGGEIVGGQVIYPIINDEWQVDPARELIVHETLARARSAGFPNAYISIRLGGYVVLAGDKSAVEFLLKNLPKTGDYPFQLINHAAFHTPLMYETSTHAFESISSQLFHAPNFKLITKRNSA